MKRDPKLYCLLLLLICVPVVLKSNDSIQSQAPLLAADNHILIEGTINGKKAFFLLDTGASYTVLHSKSAKYFNYQIFQSPTSKRKSAGVNSNSTSQRNIAIDVMLNIGQPGIKQAYFTQNLTPVVNHIYSISKIRIAGIIGTDFLKRYGCRVDFGNKLLVFS